MKNINSYIKEFSNISFNDADVNEVDCLILCQISYLNLEYSGCNPNESFYFKDLFKIENAVSLSLNSIVYKNNVKMVKLLSNSNRYKNIYFKHYFKETNNEKKQQFFAVSFFINDDIYVCFRGTDASITGWYEDFNMSYLIETPSQKLAVEYLNKMYYKYNAKIYVLGHSKGGNLALYSSIYADDIVKENIVKIYNFDGPGFNDKLIFENQKYLNIKNKVITISSSMSIIAMMMYHSDNIEFIKASGFGLFQHDSFNWHINGMKFIRENDNLFYSKLIDKITDKIMNETTPQERERLVNILFYIASETPNSSLFDIKKNPYKYINGMLKRKKLLSDEDLLFYNEKIKLIKSIISKIFKENIKLN